MAKDDPVLEPWPHAVLQTILVDEREHFGPLVARLIKEQHRGKQFLLPRQYAAVCCATELILLAQDTDGAHDSVVVERNRHVHLGPQVAHASNKRDGGLVQSVLHAFNPRKQVLKAFCFQYSFHDRVELLSSCPCAQFAKGCLVAACHRRIELFLHD